MSKLCRDTALGSVAAAKSLWVQISWSLWGAKPTHLPALSWPKGKHSASGFCTHRLHGVTEQKPAGRKLKVLIYFIFHIFLLLVQIYLALTPWCLEVMTANGWTRNHWLEGRTPLIKNRQSGQEVSKAVGINWESPGPLKKIQMPSIIKNTYIPLASLYLQ